MFARTKWRVNYNIRSQYIPFNKQQKYHVTNIYTVEEKKYHITFFCEKNKSIVLHHVFCEKNKSIILHHVLPNSPENVFLLAFVMMKLKQKR